MQIIVKVWRLFVIVILGWFVSSCLPTDDQPTPSPSTQATSIPSASPIPSEVVDTPEPTPTDEPIIEGNISIWLDWTQTELRVLQTHLADFQEKFPGIQISISYFPPNELLDRYRQAAENGQEPTILFGPSDWTKLLSQDGSLRDIYSRTTQDFIDSIQPIAWEGVSRNPFILGLPFSMEGIVLYRNRGLITEPPTALGDLVESASPLLEEGNFGIRMDVGFIYSGAFLQTCGGDFLDPNGVLLLTVEAGQCWLEILDEWSVGGLPVQNSDRDLEAFKSGQAAWLVDGTWNAPQIFKALGADQVAIDLWPIYAPTENALTGYAWSRNIFFGVSASDADFDAAWVLARYLLTPDVQLDFGESTFGLHVPVLRSVPTIQPWLQELLVAMENNIPVPQFPELAIFIEHLEVAAYDVSRRGYDPYYSILWAHPKIEKDLRFADLGDE